MRRSGPIARKTPLKRTPMKRTRSVSKAEFHPSVRSEVERRSGGRCEAQTPSCSGRAVLMHHRSRRKAGDGSVECALHVCSGCHDFIHSNVALSYEKGWLIRGG